MSATHVFAGFTLAAVVVQTAITIAFPIPPIEVHSLNYDAGVIHQDRTVTTDAEFFHATWWAYIIDADTKKPVQGCSGTASHPYEAGRIVADLTLPEWTGQEGCTREYLQMIGGEFYPFASWRWGEDGTEKEGPKFRP